MKKWENQPITIKTAIITGFFSIIVSIITLFPQCNRKENLQSISNVSGSGNILIQATSSNISFYSNWNSNENLNSQEEGCEKNICLRDKDTFLHFLLNYQDTLCSLINIYLEYDNDLKNLDDVTISLNNDVPAMKMLGKKGINNLQLFDFEMKFHWFDKLTPFKEDFLESIRLLKLAYKFLKDYFDKIEKTESSQDTITASANLSSFINTLAEISYNNEKEYGNLQYLEPNIVKGSESFSNMYQLCLSVNDIIKKEREK